MSSSWEKGGYQDSRTAVSKSIIQESKVDHLASENRRLQQQYDDLYEITSKEMDRMAGQLKIATEALREVRELDPYYIEYIGADKVIDKAFLEIKEVEAQPHTILRDWQR